VPPIQQVVGAPLPAPPVSPGAQAAMADTGSPYGFSIER
jgi:hypothetical protein